MKVLSHSGLIKKLKFPGTQIIGLQAFTEAKTIRNPIGKIYKQFRAVGFVGTDYEKSVNREAERQNKKPKFESENLKWGEYVPGLVNKILSHNGNLYLRTQTTPNQRRRQPNKFLYYRDEHGKFLEKEKAEQFIIPPRESAKQEKIGLTETAWIRTYKLDNIQKIRIGGETYLLSDYSPE